MLITPPGLPQVIGYGDGSGQSGGATVFNPLSIANCIQWLRAHYADMDSDGIGTAHTGQDDEPVGRWRDKSGAVADLTTAGGGTLPFYATGVVKGLPMVLLDGSNDRFTNAAGVASSFSGDDKANTFAIAFKKLTNTGNDTLFSIGHSVSTARVAMKTNAATNYLLDKSDGVSSVSLTGGTPDTATHVIVVRMNGTTIDIWLDGTQIVTAGAQNVLITVLDTGIVGALYQAGTLSEFASAYIGEILVYSRALDASEIAQVNTGMARTWL